MLTNWFLIFLLSWPFSLFSQATTAFENPLILGENEGLTASYITSIAEDDIGYIWIGTNNGLYRYDGVSFSHYTHHPQDSGSLISNNITDLMYDAETKQLWISTWETGKGLSILDLKTNTFKNHYHDNKLKGGLPGANLHWTFKDAFGNYWLSIQGLAKYDVESKTFRHLMYKHLPSEPSNLTTSINNILSVSQDITNDSILWLGSKAGLLKFNVITEAFKRYALVDYPGSGFTFRNVHHHSDNIVYIGTWSAGVYSFDPESEKFKKINLTSEKNTVGDQINKIYKIFPKDKSTLWIKTREGLFEYDVSKEETINRLENKIIENHVFGVDFMDKEGRIFTWINLGEDPQSDLYIYLPEFQQLTTFTKNIPGPLFSFIPRKIVEDSSSNKLWLTSQNSEGLYRLDIETSTWETFPPPPSYFIKNVTFQGWDMVQTPEGEILVLESSQIYILDQQKRQLVPWEIQIPVKNPRMKNLLLDQKGNIWVGTRYNGLFKIDYHKKEISNYYSELVPEGSSTIGNIDFLEEDKLGNIWLEATGYSVYDAQNDTFYNFPYFFPKEKLQRYIAAIGKDSEGHVWISTTSNGEVNAIGRTDPNHPEKGVIEFYQMKDHFQLKKAYTFFNDPDGSMWMMTDGLEKFSLDGKSLGHFSKVLLNNKKLDIGLPLTSGKIALGYRGGIGLFDPSNLLKSQPPLLPYVKSIDILGDKEEYLYEIALEKSLNLAPNKNFLEFEISALNHSHVGNIEFQYKLTGLEDSWQNADFNFINYTDLRNGNYTLQVRARNTGSSWSPVEYSLPIHIRTPWFRTWWACSLYLFLLLIGINLLYRFLLNKKLLEQETLRLQELDKFKSKFYSYITHEFRTPLTVIDGMTQEIKQKSNGKIRDDIHLIQRNCDTLLELVNQMLDLSKLKAGKIQVVYRKGDIIPYLDNIVQSLSPISEAKHINLKFNTREDTLIMDFDPEKIERILTNLIANSIKFTPQQGRIDVQFEKLENQILLKVTDNGQGIEPHQLPHIFDRFHQVEPNESIQGTGLGLSLVKELVEVMEGEIIVESVINLGTSFSILLPLASYPEMASQDPIESHLAKNRPFISKMPNSNNEDDLPLILIIEDNLDIAYYLKRCLNDNYQVIHELNGLNGFQKAIEKIPDIIVSDVMMPIMDGYEVCEKIKADDRTNHIPIILLTAKASHQSKMIGLNKGVDAYLSKPFKKEELLTRISNLLHQRKALQSKYQLQQENGKTKPKKEIHPFIQKVDAIILKNLEDDSLTLNELATQLFLSTSQVYRKIKAITGMSTAIYIRSIRLKQAKQLLDASNWSISEVAYKTGFSSPAYFSQAFKETYGVSPSDFQKSIS